MDAAAPIRQWKARFLKHYAPSVIARHKLRDELGARTDECHEAEEELHGAISVHRALPDEKKGWFLPVAGLVSTAVVLLEWYPAHLAALTFQSTQWGEIMALTAALALLGAALGDFGGDLLRGYRDPTARRPWVHVLFLVLVSMLSGAYVWTGYQMRLAYAIDAGIDYGVGRGAMALGLVVLAALGMVFAAIGVYHAESWDAFILRLRIGSLRRKVRRLNVEMEHLRRSYSHVDHECQMAAKAIVAGAILEDHSSLTEERIRALLLDEGVLGQGVLPPNVAGASHESRSAALPRMSNGDA